jgi:hypothetical protein
MVCDVVKRELKKFSYRFCSLNINKLIVYVPFGDKFDNHTLLKICVFKLVSFLLSLVIFLITLNNGQNWL